jgi:hypothetical protein
MRTLHATDRLFNALFLEMSRVDELRVKLKQTAQDLLLEFLMRRAILRARFSILQRNSKDAHHMLRVLAQFTHDPSP